MTDHLNELLQIAISAAREAGETVMNVYRVVGSEVTIKKDGSPVTLADERSDEVLHRVLGSTNIPILSEERKFSRESIGDDGLLWIIDPLDGTMGFIDRGGDFCIQIGLVHDSEPILGVVYIPVTDTLFYAIKNGGAFKKQGDKDAVKIHVSDVDKPSDARIVGSRHHTSEHTLKVMEDLDAESLVQSASVGLKVGMLAEGICDAYFTRTSKMGEWDVCGPMVILQEAGGVFTGLQGQETLFAKEPPLNTHGILATNSKLHSGLVAYFSKK